VILSRIDVFTKPGSTAYHGDVSTEYNNSAMNARSPFVAGVNTRQFQYLHFRDVETPQNISPALDVMGAFLGGRNANGSLDRHETHYEFQNYTTISLPGHLVQFGGYVRAVRRQEDDSENFNGTFTFNSLSDYQQTEQGLMNGLTMSQIQAAGYGPSQFNITAGNLSASVNRIDGTLFAGDDWESDKGGWGSSGKDARTFSGSSAAPPTPIERY
jgi:hypothetical protein